MTTRPDSFSDRFIADVCERLAENQRVRRNLPVWGRVHIDRQLPFLCVYRRPAGAADPETGRFATGEASYLRVAGDRKLRAGLSQFLGSVAKTLARQFGAFLLLEVWAGEADRRGSSPAPPSFRIRIHEPTAPPRTVETLAKALARVRIAKQPAKVAVQILPPHPPELPPLLTRKAAAGVPVSVIGVEISPIWRDAASGQLYPLLRRNLSRQVARAFKQAFFEFTRERTTHRPPHYHSLGKRFVTKTGWEIDRQLAEIDDSIDMILLMTPVNSETAFAEFQRSGFSRPPVFHYRPLPADPALLKRKLYEIRMERVEDPTAAALFRGKRRELDLRLNALLERDTPRALYSSLVLFGKVERPLLSVAREVLREIPPRARESSSDGRLDGEAFAEQARAEMDYYRRRRPDFRYAVHVREDLVGLMVSRGNLLVGRKVQIPDSRVEALLQHEVGTHVLTHYNGSAQRFQQMHCGLAGYEELQEGLAVFAEYLVGGLSRPRLRLLAARVVAAHMIVEGASFMETFRALNTDLGFDRKTAWTVTMRIYRGGGLTKDAIYLRGLVQLLEYFRRGGDLDPLFVGKIAAEHVPVVRELQRRKVLKPPALRPRYMDHPETGANLDRARRGLTVLDLVKGSKR